MPLSLNLRHLESKNLELQGVLEGAELDLDTADELIHLPEPLIYELEITKSANNLLIQGKLHIRLCCECSRCLKSFPFPIELDPWTCHLPLEGEERAPVSNDCVDLTPYVREDIVLAFPQQPLCDVNCAGLVKPGGPMGNPSGSGPVSDRESSPWSTLDRLDL